MKTPHEEAAQLLRIVKRVGEIKRRRIIAAEAEFTKRTLDAAAQLEPKKVKAALAKVAKMVPPAWAGESWLGMQKRAAVAKFIEEPTNIGIRDFCQGVWKNRVNRYEPAMQLVKDRLSHLAADFQFERGDVIHAERTHVSDYNTQTNRLGYARGVARMRAAFFNGLGLDAKVVEIAWTIENPTVKAPQGAYAFEVQVGVRDAVHSGLLFMRFRGLIDEVASCWRAGLNARVVHPYLPEGFEEKHGINYDGTIRPKEPAK